jgi:hypothetical protein
MNTKPRMSLRLVAAAWIGCLMLTAGLQLPAAELLVEAESFQHYGGWELDTQFIGIMGSPYLLAHGLGEPVSDADTSITFPATGLYRVWVRTKDWVARWNAPGTPGRFQLLVNGQPLSAVFGTRGAEWSWQDGGTVAIHAKSATLKLHDLTGFEGRCDAIYFTTNLKTPPPDDSSIMGAWRKKLLGLPDKPLDAGTYDLVVVGGGYAGTAAALAAARLGTRVALLQDRPVLGGNGSSEVRVWPQGKTRLGLFPKLGEIVEELAIAPTQSPGRYEEFGDAKKLAIVRAETNLTLFLNHYMYKTEVQAQRVVAVLALDVRTGAIKRFSAAYFADCTGHGTLGALAGADCVVQEEGHMGMSNMWRWKLMDTPQTFPEAPWALDLATNDFPYPQKYHGQWFWESGFNKDPLRELEYTRDWNLRAVYGSFNAMKNREGKAAHAYAKLEWVAYVGGTRESRQLLGDVILNAEDVVSNKAFPDGCVATTWSIDLHYPDERYQKKYPDDPFISKAVFDKRVDPKGYPVPYRCFYSRNLDNLFMAGRCISVTHEALGTVRVMKTGGMEGEVVGKAASLCTKFQCPPKAIFAAHWDELKELMNLPGATRRDIKQATVRPPLP